LIELIALHGERYHSSNATAQRRKDINNVEKGRWRIPEKVKMQFTARKLSVAARLEKRAGRDD
jgi:hypothetical protein